MLGEGEKGAWVAGYEALFSYTCTQTEFYIEWVKTSKNLFFFFLLMSPVEKGVS